MLPLCPSVGWEPAVGLPALPRAHSEGQSERLISLQPVEQVPFPQPLQVGKLRPHGSHTCPRECLHQAQAAGAGSSNNRRFLPVLGAGSPRPGRR